jgi:pilus assembly protein CpaE
MTANTINYPPIHHRSSGVDTAPASRPELASRATTRPTPRVTIHAYCERQDTADQLRRVGRDRRFSRASLSVQLGGLDALDRYAGETTPDLIVVESTLGADALSNRVGALADASNAHTRIIVIGHVNDILLYRELLRRKVSDYLVSPVSLAELADSIFSLCADPATRPPAQIIAFIGARGGAGSSAICHNVSWAIANGLHAQTIIADFDLAFGTTGLDFSREPARGLAEALKASDRLNIRMLDRLLSKCAEHLSLLASPPTLDDACEPAAEALAAERVVELLGQVCSYVALDVPHQWSAVTRRLLDAADDIVITAEPDLTNLRNAKSLLDRLVDARPVDRPPYLVLNKVNTPGRPEIGVKEFAGALGVEPSAIIEFDGRLFGAAAIDGLMIEEAARKSETAACFRRLAGTVTGTGGAKSEVHGLFGQILSRLNLSRSVHG